MTMKEQGAIMIVQMKMKAAMMMTIPVPVPVCEKNDAWCVVWQLHEKKLCDV